MRKTADLQPWLDYFGMLHTYEEKGLLQMETGRHEAYVTKPALHAMSSGDDPRRQLADGSVRDTVLRILGYAAFLSAEGTGYMDTPFAVHVVEDVEPHGLLYTILVTRRRSWRTLWRTAGRIEVIRYGT